MGTEQVRPLEGSFPRPSLAELGVDARSVADDTLCCRVGRVWCGRTAAEGPVTLDSSLC